MVETFYHNINYMYYCASVTASISLFNVGGSTLAMY